ELSTPKEVARAVPAHLRMGVDALNRLAIENSDARTLANTAPTRPVVSPWALPARRRRDHIKF
ncbi:hypothetical protein KJ766_02840, partial [Patescibacteria group bacterium]|nr:hypothetical protein [Patescibacteria group bacterium]